MSSFKGIIQNRADLHVVWSAMTQYVENTREALEAGEDCPVPRAELARAEEILARLDAAVVAADEPETLHGFISRAARQLARGKAGAVIGRVQISDSNDEEG